MKEMSEQKYSRNMALSLLAGIVLGAAIVLLILWALGIIPPNNQGNGIAEVTAEAGTEIQEESTQPVEESDETAESGTEKTTDTTETPETVETSEETKTPEATEKPAATDTPASTETSDSEETKNPDKTEKTDASDKSGENAGAYLSFSLSGSWGGEGGYYYQYVAVIENTTEEKITDWKITVPDFKDCEVDSNWCCEVEIKNGKLIITPADFNREIWEDGKAEGIGITILCEEEWELTTAQLEAETESGTLTGEMGEKPAESKDESNQEKQEDNQMESQTDRKVESQGAKGPDIQVGDRLAGHAVQEGTPVGDHGRLRVEDGSLVDQNGDPYQMHGVSTHGLAWFPEYVSEECFRTFRNDWDADVMRLALYSDEYGGYCNGGDQKKLKKLIDNGVEYASKLGMYVIIDWHVLGEGDPNVHKDEAIKFFDEVSEKYADYGNVIYEICNEPNGNVSWKDVKKYAEEVIPVIRANDPYGIILVGTPQWSQLVGDAAKDPIEGYDNIMYTLHFYAATHKEDLRKSLENAVKDGLPVFVSECSICDASGNGGIDEQSAEAWVKLMDKYHISYVAWAASNKNETAALINSSCSKISDWSEQELSDTGRWFKEMFTK